jgi:hypothetical protein
MVQAMAIEGISEAIKCHAAQGLITTLASLPSLPRLCSGGGGGGGEHVVRISALELAILMCGRDCQFKDEFVKGACWPAAAVTALT